MDRQRRNRLLGWLFGAWIVGVIVAGIAYRYVYRDSFPVPRPPAGAVAAPARPG